MGWETEHREKDGKDEYRIWTTISDTYLNNWSSREQIVKEHAFRIMNDAKLKVIEKFMSFPNRTIIKGRYRSKNSEGLTKFFDWQTQALESDSYYELVDEKYKEVMKILDETEWPNEPPKILYHIEVESDNGWHRVTTKEEYSDGHCTCEELEEETGNTHRVVIEEVIDDKPEQN